MRENMKLQIGRLLFSSIAVLTLFAAAESSAQMVEDAPAKEIKKNVQLASVREPSF